MSGDQKAALPARRVRIGSRIRMGDAGKVRRVSSNDLHASNGASGPERTIPSSAIENMADSTCTLLRRVLPTDLRILVAMPMNVEKRSASRNSGLNTSVNDDSPRGSQRINSSDSSAPVTGQMRLGGKSIVKSHQVQVRRKHQ